VPAAARRRTPALAAIAALALSGCAGAPTEPSSGTFISHHGAEAAAAADAEHVVERRLAALSQPPATAQLEALEGKIARARRRFLAASRWEISENGEEENTGQAETELSEGTQQMLKGLTALRAYTVSRSPAELAEYRLRLRNARARWNQGISQIWFLAHRRGAPTI